MKKTFTKKYIKEILESAATWQSAHHVLEMWRVFGNLTEDQYVYGRSVMKKEFDSRLKNA